MGPKSIYRQPGAQHFQLVHRSQRDPLIHDSEASQHVLKGFERENRKGKTHQELEKTIPFEDASTTGSGRKNIGQASLYDIYFDDTEYDYMQHLRQVGINEEGVDSILLPAPTVKTGASNKGKAKGDSFLKDVGVIPNEALPSKLELEHTYESQMEIPSDIVGFRPDMDRHLRQVLEALEDDAFVNDDLEDDFFGVLLKDGERAPDEIPKYEFIEDRETHEENVDPAASPRFAPVSNNWEAQFAKFKQEQRKEGLGTSEDGAHSEDMDTVGGLPQLPVMGGKRRRKHASDASGYSLSSSAMFRNAGLSTLDEQFAKLEKEYASDSEDTGSEEYIADLVDDDEEAPELVPVREDFDALMEDFLDRYELVGGKVRPILEGNTGAQKLETLRNAMVEGISRMDIRDNANDDDEEDNIPVPSIVGMGKDKERWDCETILSTYTNLENHPRLIHARIDNVPRIRLDRRTGLPTVGDVNTSLTNTKSHEGESLRRKALRRELLGPAEAIHELRGTITRTKNETKEGKKSRKQAVKDERQARRIEKKVMKETFSGERKQQQRQQGGKQIPMRKL